jgi:predicted RNase H-like HicB family nuclease
MDYEILIRRRGENVYAAFCPQLDLVITGTAHAEVEEKMRKLIEEHKTKELHENKNGSAEKQ